MALGDSAGLSVIGARLQIAGGAAFNSGLGQAGRSIGNFADFATMNFKRVGGVLAVVGGGILAAAKQMGAGAKEFEASMRNVQTISLETQADLEGMSDKVLDVARNTNQAGKDAADGLYQIVSSGHDGANALEILEKSSIAASAGLTDVFTSASAVVSVLNAYGQGASQAGDVTDILFQTVNLGVGSFEELAGSIGEVVGLAAVSKVSFAEIGAAISATSRSGINFSESANGVNRILVELLQPGDQLREMLGQLGYESGAAALKQDGLRGVLEKIRGAVGDNNAAYVTLFGRIEATKTALALASNGGETYAETTAKITDKQTRAAAAARAYEIQQKAVAAGSKDLRNSLSSLGNSALAPLVGLWAKALGPLRSVVDFFDRLPGPVKAGAAAMGLFVGVTSLLIGAAFLALPKLLIIAGIAFLRYNTTIMSTIQSTLALARANGIMSASMFKVVSFMANAGAIGSIVGTIGKIGLGIGVMTTAMMLFSGNTQNASEEAAKLSKNLTNAQAAVEAMNIAKALGQDLSLYDKVYGTLNKITSLGGRIGPGSDQEEVQKATALFRELAGSNIGVAKRFYESAKAGGANKQALAAMAAILKEAEQATKDSSEATGEAAVEYTNSAGQILLVSEDIKEALDEFRSSADDIRSGFGGIFDDPAEEARGLADAVRDANDAVKDANDDLARARSDTSRDAIKQARSVADAEKDVVRARRDAAKVEANSPRRQRGQSLAEFEAERADKVADANERVADAEQRLSEVKSESVDTTNRIAEAEERLSKAKEKVIEAEEKQIVSAEKLLRGLRSQKDVLLGLFGNLRRLAARGLTEPMLKELRELGPKGAAQVAALSSATDKELAEYRKLWSDNASLSQGIALQGMGQNGAAMQAVLEELWTSTGGDVGKFLELGASAGTKALNDFINNKIKTATVDARRQLIEMLPPEWKIRVQVAMDEAMLAEAKKQLDSITTGLNQRMAEKIMTPEQKTRRDIYAGMNQRGAINTPRWPWSRHSGGEVPGSPGSEVPVKALGGEFMMQRQAVNRIGIQNLQAMNSGLIHMARGGVLGRGTQAVRELQIALKAAGYSPGPIDGIFGPRTAAAQRAMARRQPSMGRGVPAPVSRNTRNPFAGGGGLPNPHFAGEVGNTGLTPEEARRYGYKPVDYSNYQTAQQKWPVVIGRSGAIYQVPQIGRDPFVRRVAGGLDSHIQTTPDVLYGERETGGEAFIPRRGSRSRAMSTLSTAAGWYGMRMIPNNPGLMMAAGGVIGRNGLTSASNNATPISLDKSTHMTNEYKIDKVITNDPGEFYRWTENRRRLDGLTGAVA